MNRSNGAEVIAVLMFEVLPSSFGGVVFSMALRTH